MSHRPPGRFVKSCIDTLLEADLFPYIRGGPNFEEIRYSCKKLCPFGNRYIILTVWKLIRVINIQFYCVGQKTLFKTNFKPPYKERENNEKNVKNKRNYGIAAGSHYGWKHPRPLIGTVRADWYVWLFCSGVESKIRRLYLWVKVWDARTYSKWYFPHPLGSLNMFNRSLKLVWSRWNKFNGRWTLKFNEYLLNSIQQASSLNKFQYDPTSKYREQVQYVWSAPYMYSILQISLTFEDHLYCCFVVVERDVQYNVLHLHIYGVYIYPIGGASIYWIAGCAILRVLFQCQK